MEEALLILGGGLGQDLLYCSIQYLGREGVGEGGEAVIPLL